MQYLQVTEQSTEASERVSGGHSIPGAPSVTSTNLEHISKPSHCRGTSSVGALRGPAPLTAARCPLQRARREPECITWRSEHKTNRRSLSESRPRLGGGAEIMQRQQKYTQGSDFVFRIVHKDLYLTQTVAGKVFTP